MTKSEILRVRNMIESIVTDKVTDEKQKQKVLDGFQTIFKNITED